MATETQADVTATTTWQNLAALNASTTSVDVMLQNKGNSTIQVVFGGSSPTDSDAGILLSPRDSVTGNAAAIWFKTGVETDEVGVILL